MSTITTDQPTPTSDSAPATPTGSATKRNLFGRKKKSAANLGTGSSSTGTIASAGSSLKSGQSAESLNDKATAAGSETVSGKGIKGVFKRKGGKSESGGGTSIGSIEEDRERESSARDSVDGDDTESGEHKERASEDDSVLSYDSEPDV